MADTATVTDPWAEEDEDANAPSPESEPAEEPTETPKTDETGTSDAEDPKKEAPPAKKAAAKKTTAKKAAPKPEAEPETAPETKPEPKAATTSPVADGPLGEMLEDQTTFITELVYGPEGTGKTTDALRMTRLCKKGQRVFFIDAEAGAKVRALRDRGVDVSRVEVWPKQSDGGPGALTFEGLYDVTGYLRKHADRYAGWIWDSGTEITKRLLDQVTAEARERDARLNKNRTRFQIDLQDHGVASSMLRELLRAFRDLPMHGVITALERRDVDEDTGKVRYGPAMSPAMANDTAGLLDIVAYKVIDSVGGEEIRSARFIPTANRRAKDRFGVMPAKLADPYFDRLVAYVNGDLDRENDPVQAHVRELAAAAAEAKK